MRLSARWIKVVVSSHHSNHFFQITRESIDVCKTYFRDDLTKADWQLIVQLKKSLDIMWFNFFFLLKICFSTHPKNLFLPKFLLFLYIFSLNFLFSGVLTTSSFSFPPIPNPRLSFVSFLVLRFFLLDNFISIWFFRFPTRPSWLITLLHPFIRIQNLKLFCCFSPFPCRFSYMKIA